MISLANIIKFFTLVLIVLLHLTLLINVQFTLWPEMVVYPYLMNNDFSLYTDIIMPYQPAFLVFLEFFSRIFGYQPLPYQILVWLLVILIDILIFFVSKKITGKISSAFASVIFFVILSIPFGINGLWFDLVQTPFIIISFYLFFLFIKNPQKQHLFFYSFLFVTFAFFIKQQAIWIIFYYLTIVFFLGEKTRSIFKKIYIYLFPLIILFLTESFLFWKNGTLTDFLYWTNYFPFVKATGMPGYISLPDFKQLVIILALFLFFVPSILQKKLEKNIIILTGLVLTLFSYPRFDYFHLVSALTVLSLAAGENIRDSLRLKVFQKITIILPLILLLIISTRFILKNQSYEVRFFERNIYTAASFLTRIIDQKETVYIQNGPDQILPLSGLKPTKPWADEFPWYLELPGMQEKIVDGIIRGNPRFIIYKPYDIGNQYDLGVYTPTKIASYTEDNYKDVLQITDTLWLKVKK